MKHKGIKAIKKRDQSFARVQRRSVTRSCHQFALLRRVEQPACQMLGAVMLQGILIEARTAGPRNDNEPCVGLKACGKGGMQPPPQGSCRSHARGLCPPLISEVLFYSPPICFQCTARDHPQVLYRSHTVRDQAFTTDHSNTSQS